MIRSCLEHVFQKEFHMVVRTIRSDAEFEGVDANQYDILILDPWTWAAKGNCYQLKY